MPVLIDRYDLMGNMIPDRHIAVSASEQHLSVCPLKSNKIGFQGDLNCMILFIDHHTAVISLDRSCDTYCVILRLRYFPVPSVTIILI